jgi:hypothetical protein
MVPFRVFRLFAFGIGVSTIKKLAFYAKNKNNIEYNIRRRGVE